MIQKSDVYLKINYHSDALFVFAGNKTLISIRLSGDFHVMHQNHPTKSCCNGKASKAC